MDPKAEAEALARLCVAVAGQINRGERLQALVLCWLTLVRRDALWFSAQAPRCEPDNASQVAIDRLVQAVADGETLSDRVLLPFTFHPLQLLLLCDRLVDQSPVDQVDGWVLERHHEGVVCVKTSGLFALDDIGPWLKQQVSAVHTVFVCPRVRSELRAPVEAQSADPDHWTPGWSLIADSPDPGSPSFRVDLKGGIDARSRAFEQLLSRSEFRVYVAELGAAPNFASWWSGPAGEKLRGWRANGLLNEEQVRDETLGHLATACRARASVIVLPELILTPNIREAITEWLFQNVGSVLPVVVAGSFHVERSGRGRPAVGTYEFVNEACVFDGYGHPVDELSHWKMRQVEFVEDAARAIEAIDLGSEMRVYHTPLGLQAVVICKDLAEAAEMGTLPLGRLPLRYLWVPSLCGSVNAHVRAAQHLALQRDVAVICANQGEALMDGKTCVTGGAGLSFVIAIAGQGRPGRLAALQPPADSSSQLFDLFERTPTPR